MIAAAPKHSKVADAPRVPSAAQLMRNAANGGRARYLGGLHLRQSAQAQPPRQNRSSPLITTRRGQRAIRKKPLEVAAVRARGAGCSDCRGRQPPVCLASRCDPPRRPGRSPQQTASVANHASAKARPDQVPGIWISRVSCRARYRGVRTSSVVSSQASGKSLGSATPSASANRCAIAPPLPAGISSHTITS